MELIGMDVLLCESVVEIDDVLCVFDVFGGVCDECDLDEIVVWVCVVCIVC